MTLFALVHGAWHGSWCWERVIPELEARGHRAVAMDMPIAAGGPETYQDGVVKAIDEARGGDANDVVLVGHSMGGLVIPYVAERTPVQRLVYLAALIPKPGKRYAELFAEEGAVMLNREIFAEQIDVGGGATTFKPGAPARFFYHDCSQEDSDWATSMLRPQYQGPGDDPEPIDVRKVPSTYIVCSDDRVVLPAWGRDKAREWLGVEPIEIEGSHSPFLSRPAELADLLVSLGSQG